MKTSVGNEIQAEEETNGCHCESSTPGLSNSVHTFCLAFNVSLVTHIHTNRHFPNGASPHAILPPSNCGHLLCGRKILRVPVCMNKECPCNTEVGQCNQQYLGHDCDSFLVNSHLGPMNSLLGTWQEFLLFFFFFLFPFFFFFGFCSSFLKQNVLMNRGGMMADLRCQLDWIWNQLKGKPPGPVVRDFLYHGIREDPSKI